MKTIIDTETTCSKYLYEDNKQVTMKPDRIEIGDPASLELIILDMNANNATLIEGVTEPDDYVGCKYNYVNGVWELCPDWVDPRLEN